MDEVFFMIMNNFYCFLIIVLFIEDVLGYILVLNVSVKEFFFFFFVLVKDGYVVLVLDGLGERVVLGVVIVGEVVICSVIFGYVMRINIGVFLFFGVDVVV